MATTAEPINSVARPINTNLVAAIPVSTTTSGEIVLGGDQLVGLHMPSAFDGTSVKFSASHDGATFVTVTDGAGSDYAPTVAASKYVPLNLQYLAGVKRVKIVSSATESAARSIVLATRPV